MAANYTQFQSIQGPTDSRLEHTTLDGLQPVSRIGEVVGNCFVDAHEFAALPQTLQGKKLVPGADDGEATVEYKPHFHEWASVMPGMIVLSRKARNATFRNYVAAETATPVIGCAACLGVADERQFYFAGICRSKTVRPIDDGVGPSIDEYFTMAMGGMATILNNSKDSIFPGDMVEWTFFNEGTVKDTQSRDVVSKRMKTMPRRVSVRVAAPSSERIIGRALTFAKKGETFDILIRAA
jgi:hypothetical protein